MLITIKIIANGTRMKAPWIYKRLAHIQEEYILQGQSVFNIDKVIHEIERQLLVINKSHNQAQTEKSKNMLKLVLDFVKTIK